VLEVTDAPFDHQIVEQATVWIDRVRIHRGSNEEVIDENDGEWIEIEIGDPLRLDLLDLQGGVSETLAEAELPAGHFDQIRLHVSQAELVLINDRVYSTEDDTIHLTSQDTSGFKLHVQPPIEVISDQSTRVLLDFDLTKTFHPIPANDPLAASRYQFHPVIRVTNLGLAGEIRGRSLILEGPDLVPLPGAVIYLLASGETEIENAVGSTSSDELGAFVFLGLHPGEYDLLAQKDGLEGRTNAVLVAQGEVTEAEVELE
jgi:hypothetical protein